MDGAVVYKRRIDSSVRSVPVRRICGGGPCTGGVAVLDVPRSNSSDWRRKNRRNRNPFTNRSVVAVFRTSVRAIAPRMMVVVMVLLCGRRCR